MLSQPCIHISARAHACPVPLYHPEVAAYVWPRLQETFPQAVGASLMGNHLHCSVPGRDIARVRRKTAHLLSGFSRSHNPVSRCRWERTAISAVPPDPQRLARDLRYILLNPVRAGLVDDPIEWPWSTYRDFIGAVEPPWVTAAQVVDVVGAHWLTSAESIHRYVAPDRSRLPRLDLHGRLPNQDLVTLVATALATTRADPSTFTQRSSHVRGVLASVMRHVGWPHTESLAAIGGLKLRRAQELIRDAAPISEAALLNLSDERLTRQWLQPARKLLRRPQIERTRLWRSSRTAA